MTTKKKIKVHFKHGKYAACCPVDKSETWATTEDIQKVTCHYCKNIAASRNALSPKEETPQQSTVEPPICRPLHLIEFSAFPVPNNNQFYVLALKKVNPILIDFLKERIVEELGTPVGYVEWAVDVEDFANCTFAYSTDDSAPQESDFSWFGHFDRLHSAGWFLCFSSIQVPVVVSQGELEKIQSYISNINKALVQKLCDKDNVTQTNNTGEIVLY